eukprot:g2108.t1
MPQATGESKTEEVEELEQEVFLGGLPAHVVGLRYYDGIVSNKEQVNLVREPQNSYDANAVGHISRDTALYLAPVMDSEIRVEGTILNGSNNVYRMPVDLHFYGLPSQAESQAFIRLKTRLPGFSVVPPPAVTARGGSCAGMTSPRTGLPTSVVLNISESISPVRDSRAINLILAPKANFDTMPTMEPAPCVLTELKEFQKMGLAWMRRREEPATLSSIAASAATPKSFLFWSQQRQRDGSMVFHNSATQSRVRAQPEMPLGGVLADDMGLGKTLEMISLMATHPAAAQDPVRATLIVCPLSVISNWTQQLEEHVAFGTFNVGIYHGPERKALQLDAYNRRLPQEYKVQTGKLFKPRWLRVVLDEAHVIRNRAAQSSLAVAALNSKYRWSLTGTPLQNRVEDAYAIFRFLGVEPFAKDFAWWQRLIKRPIRKKDPMGLGNLQTLFGDLCLRQERGDEMIEFGSARACTIQKARRGLTQLIWWDAARQLGLSKLCHRAGDAATAATKVPERYKEGFASLVQHDKEKTQHLLDVLKKSHGEECCICLDTCQGAVVTECGHTFCQACIELVIRLDKPSCPLCRAPISEADLITSEKAQELAKDMASTETDDHSGPRSTKIQQLLTDLKELPPNAKAMIFSQWTSMLALVKDVLVQEGVDFVELTGASSRIARTTALQEFRTNPAKRCFTRLLVGPVLKPRRGGPGVRPCAPYGPRTNVQITRYVCQGTVEGKILQLQSKKRQIIGGVLTELPSSKDQASKAQQERLQDLMELFAIQDKLSAVFIFTADFLYSFGQKSRTYRHLPLVPKLTTTRGVTALFILKKELSFSHVHKWLTNLPPQMNQSNPAKKTQKSRLWQKIWGIYA